MPFKANNNREAVVVCARHVVKRPSKRSVLVYINLCKYFNNVVNHFLGMGDYTSYRLLIQLTMFSNN